MTSPPRAKPFVTQMRRGQLQASSCRHPQVDGHHRQSGRNALVPKRDHPPSNIMSPVRNQPGPRTEIRLGVPRAQQPKTATIPAGGYGDGGGSSETNTDFNSEAPQIPDSTDFDSEGLTGTGLHR
jgi:hypothetical protein